MDDIKKQPGGQQPLLTGGVLLSLALHTVLVCAMCYGVVYVSQMKADMHLLGERFDNLSVAHEHLKLEMAQLEEVRK